MKRRTDRARERAERKIRKQHSMAAPSGNSNYGRKHAYCARLGVHGWEVPEPKPWRQGPVASGGRP